MKTWTTADGTEIPVNKLKDSHILNILKKWPDGTYTYIEGSWDYINNRPDGAWEEVGEVPGYRDVKEEAEKRKLI